MFFSPILLDLSDTILVVVTASLKGFSLLTPKVVSYSFLRFSVGLAVKLKFESFAAIDRRILNS